MKIKSNAVMPFEAATDQREKEGYFVDGAGVIMANATDKPFACITEPGNEGQTTSAAACDGGFAGTVAVKLAAAAGTVIRSTKLVLSSATLGTLKASTGTAGEVVCAVAFEAGVNNELVEAALIRPYIIGPDTIDDDSITAGKIADGAVVTAALGADAVIATKIADDAIQTEHLHDTIADGIRTTTVAVANTPVTPDGVAHVTGQVKDIQGNALAGRFCIYLFLSATAYGAPTDLGALTALANSTVLKADTADALAHVLTHSDGSWGVELDTAADGTVHCMASIGGAFATASAAITGNA